MLSKKVLKIITASIRIILVVAFIAAIFFQKWFSSFISLSTFFLTFLPFNIEDRYHIKFPVDFEIAIIFFLFASLFLGELGNFYHHFWWWDILLHFSSAIAFGCVGFIILFYLNKSNKISSKPIWVAIFSFAFAVSVGAVWEIFEFAMDQIFGMNMQKSGLMDTMWDLIIDVAGALIASLTGFAYLKGSQRSYLGRMIHLFIKQNPKLKL
jgi:hypothetical protein